MKEEKKSGIISGYIKKKNVGFYISLLAWILTLAHMFVYRGIAEELYSAKVFYFALAGVVAFVVLSLFSRTSELAPIALMVCNFMCIVSFAAQDGVVDYFSTQFFDGFSIEAVFKLPVSVWFSLLAFVAAFILSSLAMYIPQVRRKKNKAKD